MKITYTELFTSLQGEGINQGVPSIFLRLFGCNFRCKNFNLPKDTIGDNKEVQEVIKDISKYKKFEELPLLSTGCDTYASIYSEFKHLAKTVEIEELAVELINEINKTGIRDLVITGGEPLLPGQQRKLIKLFEILDDENCMINSITFETNGSQRILDEFYNFFSSSSYKIIMSASIKLSNSGEKIEERINPAAILDLSDIADILFYKFVVSDDKDLEEIEDIIEMFPFQDYVYLMPVGGTMDPYSKNSKWVAEQCIKKGYRYSPRLQIDLWKNQWGT